jgi:RNase P subunit RPR2
MKDWCCAKCGGPLKFGSSAGDRESIGRGRWWVEIRCVPCNKVCRVTKRGVGIVKDALQPGRVIG